MDILEKSPLFAGIATKDIPLILGSLSAYEREYGKGEFLIWEGDRVDAIGVLLSGTARSTKTDWNGKLVLVTVLEPGQLIGVLLAASRERESPVAVQALEPLRTLWIPFRGLLTRACPCQARLLENLLDGMAEKALVLHDRNDCLMQPSVREKVLTFLTCQAQKAGALSFRIPMGREAMAEYLDVDRSALSRELSWMKRDGWIAYRKNWFQLKR